MASSYQNNTGVRVTRATAEIVSDNLRLLADLEVLVGFPEDSTERDETATTEEGKEPITNAALGYIHDNGAPEVNIPARPFMKPAIEENKEKIERALSGAMRQAMRGLTPCRCLQELDAVQKHEDAMRKVRHIYFGVSLCLPVSGWMCGVAHFVCPSRVQHK